MSPYVIKADGEQQIFEPEKLNLSLKRAGAAPDTRDFIVSRVARLLEDEDHPIPTELIYQRAFELLRKSEKTPVAARYSVKRAVLELGPSGYPFERFFAEVLKAQGWKTRTGVALTGRCVPHEVDVLAERGGKRIGVEAKFHNSPGLKTDVKDALYVKARYDDLRQAPLEQDRVDEGWLVTNTQFTRNAIRYGRCAGLVMLGWDYPRDRGILSMIEAGQVHPLTCLTTLSQGEKQRLLEKNVVLCRAVSGDTQLLRDSGVHPEKIADVQEEARQLCTVV